MCDDDCPACGSRHFSPEHSDDLSVIIEKNELSRFDVLYSHPQAEHEPDYQHFAEVGIERLALILADVAAPLTLRA